MTNFQDNLIAARDTARDILAGVATEKEKRELFQFLDGVVKLDSKSWNSEIKIQAE